MPAQSKVAKNGNAKRKDSKSKKSSTTSTKNGNANGEQQRKNSKGKKSSINGSSKNSKHKNKKSIIKEESKEEEHKNGHEYRESKAIFKIPNFSQLDVEIHELQSFGTMYDSEIDSLKSTFEMFERLLKHSKKECLKKAKEYVSKENKQTPNILINVERTKTAINSIGTELGIKEWQLTKETLSACNALREIMIFEDESTKSNIELHNIQNNLINEQKEISIKKETLSSELSIVEPILNDAKKALKNIERSRLDELRRLPKAAPIVENVVKSLLILTGIGLEKDFDEWNNYKKNLTFSFIQSLEKFEAKDISDNIRNIVLKYIESDEFEESNLRKANTTCPALVSWMKAQLKYNEYIPKVQPIKEKVELLQNDLKISKEKEENLQLSINELNKRIKNSQKQMRQNIFKVVQLQDDIKKISDSANA